MRILKIRRGFTTNSSSANEWVPPPGWKDPTKPTLSNSQTIGILAVVVFVLVAIERVIRRKLRSRKNTNDESAE